MHTFSGSQSMQSMQSNCITRALVWDRLSALALNPEFHVLSHSAEALPRKPSAEIAGCAPAIYQTRGSINQRLRDKWWETLSHVQLNRFNVEVFTWMWTWNDMSSVRSSFGKVNSQVTSIPASESLFQIITIEHSDITMSPCHSIRPRVTIMHMTHKTLTTHMM